MQSYVDLRADLDLLPEKLEQVACVRAIENGQVCVDNGEFDPLEEYVGFLREEGGLETGNPLDIVYDCVDLVDAAGDEVALGRLVRVLAEAGMSGEVVRQAVQTWVALEGMRVDGDYVELVRGRSRGRPSDT